MALDTLPGPSCESLCGLGDADAYHESRGNIEKWSVLGSGEKEIKLRNAYDWLVGEYAGQWPAGLQFGAENAAGDVPRRMREACALLALYAIEAPLNAPPSTAPQVIEKTVGPMTKKYATQDAPVRRTFPDVARMVAPFLAPVSTPYSAKLVRN